MDHRRLIREGGASRRWLIVAVVGLVLAVHAWVGREFGRLLDAWREGAPAISSVEVRVGGSLKPMQPLRRPRAAPPPLEVATAAVEGSDAAATLMPGAPPVPPIPEVPTVADAVAGAAAGEGASAAAASGEAQPVAAAAAVVDPWPPSTRIRYRLKGNYRGEFGGSAQVVWLRDGDRYRVELEVMIGPKAAPIMSRKVISEGTLGPEGLSPRRYEEDTRVLFGRGRRATITFEAPSGGQPGAIVLQDGTRRPAVAGTQDSASQFVQLAWLFGTQATPVKTGDRVTVALALPRRSDLWTYVVGEPMTVDTPAGPVETLHARPQREIDPLRRDLIAEVWFAPSLQYLPVRMQVILDPETFALMVMEGLPEVISGELGPPGAARR